MFGGITEEEKSRLTKQGEGDSHLITTPPEKFATCQKLITFNSLITQSEIS